MGSTARRGGDGVRYCGGRSPRGGRKDAALIILTDPEDIAHGKGQMGVSKLRRNALAAGGCKAGILDHTD